jgi:hypothetical protein
MSTWNDAKPFFLVMYSTVMGSVLSADPLGPREPELGFRTTVPSLGVTSSVNCADVEPLFWMLMVRELTSPSATISPNVIALVDGITSGRAIRDMIFTFK